MPRSVRLVLLSIGIVVCCLLLIFVGVDTYLRLQEPLAYRNSSVCPKLRPEISLVELKSALGEPVYVERKGNDWLYFATPSIHAGAITAEVDLVSEKVIALRCYEDGPPTWTITP